MPARAHRTAGDEPDWPLGLAGDLLDGRLSIDAGGTGDSLLVHGPADEGSSHAKIATIADLCAGRAASRFYGFVEQPVFNAGASAVVWHDSRTATTRISITPFDCASSELTKVGQRSKGFSGCARHVVK